MANIGECPPPLPRAITLEEVKTWKKILSMKYLLACENSLILGKSEWFYSGFKFGSRLYGHHKY